MTLPIRPLQFAVVREDPRLEAAIVRERRAQHAPLVASGGARLVRGRHAPMATATVLHRGMPSFAWRTLLTSDI